MKKIQRPAPKVPFPVQGRFPKANEQVKIYHAKRGKK